MRQCVVYLNNTVSVAIFFSSLNFFENKKTLQFLVSKGQIRAKLNLSLLGSLSFTLEVVEKQGSFTQTFYPFLV